MLSLSEAMVYEVDNKESSREKLEVLNNYKSLH
jgi:hypothetical protein